MPQSERQIRADMLAYVSRKGGLYRTWYVGVTDDPERRLFVEHQVSKESGTWRWRTAYSAAIARRVEQDLLTVGLDGGAGGGNPDSLVVYVYKKTLGTRP